MQSSSTFWRYALVGLTVALLYVLLFLAFIKLGLPQVVANALAFGLAVAFQYIAQARFTYATPLNDAAQIGRFVAMIALGLFISALITGLIGPALHISDWLAAAIVTVILPLQNYLIMTRWVFSDPCEQMETSQ